MSLALVMSCSLLPRRRSSNSPFDTLSELLGAREPELRCHGRIDEGFEHELDWSSDQHLCLGTEHGISSRFRRGYRACRICRWLPSGSWNTGTYPKEYSSTSVSNFTRFRGVAGGVGSEIQESRR